MTNLIELSIGGFAYSMPKCLALDEKLIAAGMTVNSFETQSNEGDWENWGIPGRQLIQVTNEELGELESLYIVEGSTNYLLAVGLCSDSVCGNFTLVKELSEPEYRFALEQPFMRMEPIELRALVNTIF